MMNGIDLDLLRHSKANLRILAILFGRKEGRRNGRTIGVHAVKVVYSVVVVVL